ncbi:MAG: folate-binding protein YgfZ [Pseudomonadota bacterium]|nr:MAG: folate-binding protein YgfZ [Pseudomonadota bacterium]
MSRWIELPQLAAIRMTGSDAGAFAQAQFTADSATISDQFWHPLAWCDPKGRVLSFMLANRSHAGIDLIVPAVQLDFMANRLPVYAIGRQVSFEPTANVRGTFAPQSSDASLAFDPARALSVAPADPCPEHAAASNWRYHDLRCALPWLQPDTAGRHLPQSLGLEPLGAISYDKGCYPGQEIIARVHYLGRSRYRTVALRLDQIAEIAANSAVYAGERKAGNWLWGTRWTQVTLGLAVVDDALQPEANLTVETASGRISGQVTPVDQLC